MPMCQVWQYIKVKQCILKEYILRRGFRPQYWHCEEGVYEGKIEVLHEEECFAHMVENDNGYEIDENNANKDIDRVDEMMERVKDELGKHPCAFNLLTQASQKPLCIECTKFTKLTTMLAIFNIKSKFNQSDSSFAMLLKALGEMFPDGYERPKSTYYAKKLKFLLAQSTRKFMRV